MRRLLWTFLCFGLLASPAPAAEGDPLKRVGLLPVDSRGNALFEKAWTAARAHLQELPLDFLEPSGWKHALRKRDKASGLMDEVGRTIARGRELQLGLKMEEALFQYRQALRRLEAGFVRYYEPARLAEVLLLSGVAQHQLGQAKQARKSFMRALALAHGLELAKGYYGPSVRQVFAEARIALGPLRPGPPRPVEVGRLCRAAKLDGMIVAWVERMGQRHLLRLSLFDAAQGQFVAVESGLLDAGRAEQVGLDQARRLADSLAQALGLELPGEEPDAGSRDGGAMPDAGAADAREADAGALDGGQISPAVDGGSQGATDAGAPYLDGLTTTGADEGPGEEVWYCKHWWIWPAAAVVVGTAIVLPLTVFREDVVDVHVRP